MKRDLPSMEPVTKSEAHLARTIGCAQKLCAVLAANLETSFSNMAAPEINDVPF